MKVINAIDRIKEQASWVASTTSADAWEMRRMRILYEKAAINERNETIDEIIVMIKFMERDPSRNDWDSGFNVSLMEVERELESLKIKE